MIHRNEYMISSGPQGVDWGWKHLRLANGYTLSFDETLRVTANKDNSVVLLGRAWQVVPERKSPYAIVRESLGGATCYIGWTWRKRGVEGIC